MTTRSRSARAASNEREPLLIDLALQGGGSHGAFTWGVLDRLLEVPWLRLDGISGTSAGAMNAAVLAHGLLVGWDRTGDRDAARATAKEALEGFWRAVSDAARFSPFQRGPLEILTGRWTLDMSPAYLAVDLATRVFSPYDATLQGPNPLRSILERCVDFARLNTAPIRIFVTATNVRTGRGRVFRNADLTPDALLASACLPTMFQAVEIDGDPYWDGGFTGNPTITPLVRECASEDTILVQINPIERAGTPRTATQIQSRLNEISFNSPLMKELRMAAMLRRVADPGSGEGGKWARMRVHRIASETMTELSASSKMLAEWAFLCMLRDEGRRAAGEFLDAHGDDVGVRSSLDLDTFLAEG
jgi:NTE family protein